MKRAIFNGTFPSIMLMSLVQKRYFPLFSLICLAVAGRPRYSMTNEPLGMRSWVKRPLPLCDRRTVSRKGARINHRSSGKDTLLHFLFRHPSREPINIHPQPQLLALFNRHLSHHSKRIVNATGATCVVAWTSDVCAQNGEHEKRLQSSLTRHPRTATAFGQRRTMAP